MFTILFGVVGFVGGVVRGSSDSRVPDTIKLVHCFVCGVAGAVLTGAVGLAIDSFLLGRYFASAGAN